MQDKKSSNSIEDRAFDYRITKDDKIFITWYGKQVKILSGTESLKFLKKINGATEYEKQMILAKITGNFKRGNEKLFKKGLLR